MGLRSSKVCRDISANGKDNTYDLTVPKRLFQIICTDVIRIVRRWSESNREVAECNIKEVL